ncbi:hypothetical protein PybrP1_008615 [[Pythium] brassicae (nom. inval.)]|nr:hypothetical protein PybrP1_008615 [[Pythium] brassicae (nom. inval.)]
MQRSMEQRLAAHLLGMPFRPVRVGAAGEVVGTGSMLSTATRQDQPNGELKKSSLATVYWSDPCWVNPSDPSTSRRSAEPALFAHEEAEWLRRLHVLHARRVVFYAKPEAVDSAVGTKSRATVRAQLDSKLWGVLQAARRQLHQIALARLERILHARATGILDGRQPRGPEYVFVFGGGSRGSPDPGGSGAVVVQLNANAHPADIVWVGCM